MRDAILQKVQSIRCRMIIARIVRSAVRGFLVGAVFAVAMAGSLWIGGPDLSRTAWGCLLGVPAIAVVREAFRSWLQADWDAAARAVDQRYELKNRVETAIAFVHRSQLAANIYHNDIELLQIADAARHLQVVEPRRIVPEVLPRSWRWAASLTTVALILLCWPSARSPVSASSPESIPELVAEANELTSDLEDLQNQLQQQAEIDPQLAELLQELAAKAEELKTPGVEVRDALAKLSEMQSALQQVLEKFNGAASEEVLKSIGEALRSAAALEQPGESLQNGEFANAAEELANLETPMLDRKESRAVSDKLKQAGDVAAKKDLAKLKEAVKELAEGFDKGDAQQTRSGLSKLSESAKAHAQRMQVADLLKKQHDRFAESKANCLSANQGERSGSKQSRNGGRQAGKGTNSQTQGDRTKLASQPRLENLQGQKGETGDTEIENVGVEESDEQAQRAYRDVYQKYRKLSEAVLDAEDIPLGHRQTIRRYFEAIRPTRDDASVTSPPIEK